MTQASPLVRTLDSQASVSDFDRFVAGRSGAHQDDGATAVGFFDSDATPTTLHAAFVLAAQRLHTRVPFVKVVNNTPLRHQLGVEVSSSVRVAFPFGVCFPLDDPCTLIVSVLNNR